jgi:hypothetical protein
VLGRFVDRMEEWTAREEADRLCYGGLEEPAERGVCGAVGGEDLAKCEEG